MRRTQRMLILLLSVMLTVGLLPTTVQAEETAAGKFILVAEAGGKLVIVPEYITYSEGQTVKEALAACENHQFSGLQNDQVTAINGVTGSFTRSDQAGGVDLNSPASSVTHYRFSENVSGSQPKANLMQLMTAMADYLEKSSDVQNAAKTAYQEALEFFVDIKEADARTYAAELNTAIRDYEATLTNQELFYSVSFTDGSKLYSDTPNTAYSGIVITAVNEYGRQWQDDGDGILELPAGNYTFCVNLDGISFAGEVSGKAKESVTVTGKLPEKLWLKQKTFRLSGSLGSDDDEFSKFIDAEFAFEFEDWNGRQLTVPVLDSFSGAVYTYAEYDKDLLSEVPTLTAVYTMQNSAQSAMEKVLALESLNSGAYSVLAMGPEGNTVIYRLSSEGADGYMYTQDYTVIFKRVPTLLGITVQGDDGEGTTVEQVATAAFERAVGAYTYKILDSVQSVTIGAEPAVDNYQVTINGQNAADGVTVPVNAGGETTVSVTVSSETDSNTYTLTFLSGEGKTLSFNTASSVTVQVLNANGLVMPYTIYRQGTDTNRYKYILIPGETYSYVATYNQDYHIADNFTMDGTGNATITVDFSGVEDWLTELVVGTGSNRLSSGKLTLSPAFSQSNHRYQTTLIDTLNYPYIWVDTEEDYMDICAVYQQASSADIYHGRETTITLEPGEIKGQRIDQFLMDENPIENRLTIRLSKEIGDKTHYQDYHIDVKRSLTLKNLSTACDGTKVVLLQKDKTEGFLPSVKEYSITVPLSAQNVVLSMERYFGNTCYGEEEVGYRILVDGKDVTQAETGAASATIALNGTIQTQTVTIEVKNDKAPEGTGVYILNIQKAPPVKTTITSDPAGAQLSLYEARSKERIWPDSDGRFLLCEGYEYPYTLTEKGYVGRTGTLRVTYDKDNVFVIYDGDTKYTVTETADGTTAQISWSLEKAPANSTIQSVSYEWPSFRRNADNNAVTERKIPTLATDATLYWAKKIGSGQAADAVGSPILVGGDLITYAGSSLIRVDTVTGDIKKTGEMDHRSSFSITPPAYADGMIFVALSNGCIQAFDAHTLQSLWIYHDPLGGQPNSPITVKDGYLYTGFWNQEDGDANFVCLSITDEDPSQAKETKANCWYHTAKGGYYWAGAYVGDGFVLVGTDDGADGCTSQTSKLLLLDAKSGKILDSWDNLDGDIRSTIVHSGGAYYFTSKGGSFYRVRVSDEKKLTEKWILPLQNDTDGTPMSTSSPVVYNGRAYIGVSGSSQYGAYSGHNITVIDLESKKIAYSVPTQGYPQTSGLLTTAYEAQNGYVYVYFFDNMTPGKLRVLQDKPGITAPMITTEEAGTNTAYALFTPTNDHAQHVICSPIADEYGTIYFKNDSGYLMAFGSSITKLELQGTFKIEYEEGETFDATGMQVMAHYANGESRDVTKYVTYNQNPLTYENKLLTISFKHVLYHNKESGTGMVPGEITTTPQYLLELTVGDGVMGDVNGDGSVNGDDTKLILDYEAKIPGVELSADVADVSGDGKVDSNDATLILQYAKGKLAQFPAESNADQTQTALEESTDSSS